MIGEFFLFLKIEQKGNMIKSLGEKGSVLRRFSWRNKLIHSSSFSNFPLILGALQILG